jgi:hypothetical protein
VTVKKAISNKTVSSAGQGHWPSPAFPLELMFAEKTRLACSGRLARLALLAWAAGGLSSMRAGADSAATYLACLTNFETYAETIWHPAAYTGAPADAGYWGDGGSSGNGGIRGNSGIAVAYATLVVAQPGHPQNSLRLDRIRQALNYDTATHVTGTNPCVDGQSWGWSSASSGDWQTPLWAGSMGLACLLVQTNLPAATVSNVQRVVASEADHRAAIAPASGFVSDTKAEENAWQGNILALAAAWMSAHPNGSNWLYAAKLYCANSYTVADTTGDPLASWVSTVTLYPSFALENHGFYHPTYEMVAGMSLGDSLLMAKLADPALAAQLRPFAEHNVLAVWTNNLNALVLDSGDFAYPAGLDWELHDFEQNSFIAWMAAHLNDPLARWTDDRLAQCIRHRQLVNGDGRFVGPSGGGFYREAVGARRTAIAWLHWANADFPGGLSVAPGNTLMHNTDVQVIHQRSAFGSFSVSYRNSRIMAVVEPASLSVPTNAFVASPRLPGIIGLGALGIPTAAQLLSFTLPPGGTTGFEAELRITNGSLGTTEAYVKSTGETFAIVEVPWPGAGATATSAGSFSCGIENDPLTGGTRLLEWTGGAVTVTNRSGVARTITNHWICVAGRYGLAAGPEGYFRYQTAAGYNRLGAAEDTLQFMSQNTLGPRYAIWFPAKNASQTLAGASLVTWTNSGTAATLTFPGPTGSLHQITVGLPQPTPYPPYAVMPGAVTASSSQPSYPPTNAVDGNLSTFWVSSGSSPGQGPTPDNPEWLQFAFPRPVAVSEFQIAPRTLNGGYGPKTIEMILDGNSVYAGTMVNATLEVRLTQPADATNAQLLITASYDPLYPDNSRNVQVVEVTYFERALPGTFADWTLHQFNDAQLADPLVSGPRADPDQDGAANLLEFAAGGGPLVPDAANARLSSGPAAGGQFALRFRERKQLGNVVRRFEASLDLDAWAEVVPVSVNAVQDLGETAVLEALFPLQSTPRFFRLRYRIE